MLTKRQNLLETIKKGGKPDRFVNQFEFMELIFDQPWGLFLAPGSIGKDKWGVTFSYPIDQIGQFPLHDPEHKVLKDITQWKKYVNVPEVPTSDEAWASAVAHAKSVDRNDKFVATIYCPGMFEQVHHLMGMEDAMMALYEEPEAMHELLNCMLEYELAYAKEAIARLQPDCLFHHDDWGSQISSFLSPEMFREFILPVYKKLYGFYKANGVELIVHHSDSYGVNLVPSMIEMGIDIWQGVMKTNNIPELVKKYEGQITFMGGIHSGEVDFPGWTQENCAKHVEQACRTNGNHSYIPCITQGGPGSAFPGVYDALSKEIDRMSNELF
ncbi:uroporphyrinogen decarboxylase [Dehalobacter sp. DCM]|uniref:uroporphyrinogen decarboxylase family protein n=1 Tax=Dehalobacter sp. DCM TaxID=2907827 RepID=UPI0030816BF0|nr:uroporphyrinogen decarboxylase [Dehalobacter sp. DCM]